MAQYLVTSCAHGYDNEKVTTAKIIDPQRVYIKQNGLTKTDILRPQKLVPINSQCVTLSGVRF